LVGLLSLVRILCAGRSSSFCSTPRRKDPRVRQLIGAPDKGPKPEYKAIKTGGGGAPDKSPKPKYKANNIVRHPIRARNPSSKQSTLRGTQ
jgi:hypothetical protein